MKQPLCAKPGRSTKRFDFQFLNRSICTILATCFTMLCALGADENPSKIRVLFLGDNGHHRPADRFKDFQPAWAGHKMEVDYTESLEDLNPAKLAGYDCLMIYANHTKISPEQESALLNFVQNGGGLAAIHCASYCFLNSPKYIELVGAQFKSHNTGVFKETVLDPSHPVMSGLSPIESWDETYVHTMHNTNRLVLAERREENHVEPYTWVRTSGKGRVFYTAWGHDSRTWTNVNFRGLLMNGIRWASEKSPSRLKARAGLPALEYMDAGAPLPNYVPGAKWGTQSDPFRTMQKPLAPAESVRHLVTLPEFEPKLFAAEPDIAKPIWMSWDSRGRLWIAETVDYPNNMQPPGQGHDRIKICEDTDGDGRADKFTVFADQLSVPTGFVFANGGLILVHSGKTEFLKDSTGGDKANSRTVLFSGWGTNDTHAGPSNLRYGFDNWIWGTVGYSGFHGIVGGREIRFGQGIFRFKSDGSALEYIRASNNNTWGLGLSEEGIIFGSTANGNASMYMPIANRFYEAVSGWSAARLETIADSQEFFAITEKVRQVDWHGKYTAGAGSALYTARNFPREYWNRVQFVAEPTGHLLGKFHLEARGADFIAHDGRNFAASDDEWTSPICAEVGPDGALWMIDWYNYVVQHNPTPYGFQTGKGNAYETPLRDKTHGRIYRLVWNEAKKVAPLNLEKAGAEQLVSALSNDNLLWRITAQRLLVERQKMDIVPALCALVNNQAIDEIGLNTAAIHALWTLDGIGALKSGDSSAAKAVTAALSHPSAGVRRNAVAVIPRTADSLKELLGHNLLEDSDAQVRLATLLAISEMPPSDDAGAAIYAMFKEPKNLQDTWIADAATCAAARNAGSFLKTALLEHIPSDTNSSNRFRARTGLGHVLQRVSAHLAHEGTVESLLPLLTAMKGGAADSIQAVMDGFASGWPQAKTPNLSDGVKSSLAEIMQGLPDSARVRLQSLAQKWHQPELFSAVLAKLASSLEKKLADPSVQNSERIAAATELLQVQDQPQSVQAVLNQVTLLATPDLAVGLIGALAESRRPDTGIAVVKQWGNFTPAVRRAQISLLLRRAEWSAAMLDAIEGGTIRKTDLASEHWSQLKQYPNREIAGRAEKLSGSSGTISSDRAEIVKRLLPIAKEPGDWSRGKEVFTANCVICHTFNGQGGKVGPELTGIGARDRSEILIDILDPNRSVEANYRLWHVSTKDGEVFSGRLETETQTSVEILDATGQKHVVQRSDIERLDGSQMSIMPNGFESLPPNDLKSLLTFLTQPANQALAH